MLLMNRNKPNYLCRRFLKIN